MEKIKTIEDWLKKLEEIREFLISKNYYIDPKLEVEIKTLRKTLEILK